MPSETVPSETVPFALGLGGNLGPVESTLRRALESLARHLGPLEVAPLYRTAPVPSPAPPQPPQPDYLNTAAVGATPLPPDAVLALAKALELHHGRRRPRHGGRRDAPRSLDVDLLLYGRRVSRRRELTLPHPRLAERRFVLEPLARVAGDWPVPAADDRAGDGPPSTVRELLAACRDRSRVERIGWS